MIYIQLATRFLFSTYHLIKIYNRWNFPIFKTSYLYRFSYIWIPLVSLIFAVDLFPIHLRWQMFVCILLYLGMSFLNFFSFNFYIWYFIILFHVLMIHSFSSWKNPLTLESKASSSISVLYFEGFNLISSIHLRKLSRICHLNMSRFSFILQTSSH